MKGFFVVLFAILLQSCGSENGNGTPSSVVPVTNPGPGDDEVSAPAEPKTVEDYIEEANPHDAYWGDYWSWDDQNKTSNNTQYQRDTEWQSMGNQPFIPYRAKCKDNFISMISGDPDAPTLQLLGDSVVQLPLNSKYTDPGVMAFDSNGADISGSVEVFGTSEIDTTFARDYLLSYRVVDAEGRKATPISRTVRVVDAEPVIETRRRLGTTLSPVGYVEHLPTDYGDELTKTYPLIVYIHGWGATADKVSLDEMSQFGLSLAIRTHGKSLWQGDTEFLALSPHRNVTMGNFNVVSVDQPIAHTCEIRAFMDFALTHYPVDRSRIYLGGFSNGSVTVWEYLRHFSGDENRVAATVNIAGGSYLQEMCSHAAVPSWSLRGGNDGDASSSYPWLAEVTHELNHCPDGAQVGSIFTVVPGVGHVSRPFLENEMVGNSDPRFSPASVSIYEWLLQYQNHWFSPGG